MWAMGSNAALASSFHPHGEVQIDMKVGRKRIGMQRGVYFHVKTAPVCYVFCLQRRLIIVDV
jgi:hypothetical protein